MTLSVILEPNELAGTIFRFFLFSNPNMTAHLCMVRWTTDYILKYTRRVHSINNKYIGMLKEFPILCRLNI